jgi:pimeloyl-ACP methyl ester carboxylesterase
MIIEDYEGPFSKRMEKLENLLGEQNDLILVGSSFGGLMASVYTCRHEDRVKKLILLAPALHLEFYRPYRNHPLDIPVVVFHGLRDTIVPLEDVRNIAEQRYRNCEFNAVDDDHVLQDTFASIKWDFLLDLT